MTGTASAGGELGSSQFTSSSPSRSVEKLKFIVLGGANAGKTSILRQYFHGSFDPARRPTVGSDFYTKKISQQPDNNNNEVESSTSSQTVKNFNGSLVTSSTRHKKASLSVQVWDTPGRERFAANQTRPLYTAAFSDSFFKSADAAILVYDITSSTSFTHVLKWFEDLMTRIRRLELSGERTRPFPVVIVGNKIDIMRQRDTHPSRQRQAVVAQRDVLGMTEKDFRGKDLHYEYTACPPQSSDDGGRSNSTTTAAIPSRQKKGTNDRHRFELSTYMGTGEKTNYLQAVLNNDVQIGSYLESLLSTEDGSHPDKDMVLLWCMRNGLKHMEVSALDGTGIEDMISEVVDMAMEARLSTAPATSPTNRSKESLNPESSVLKALLKRNDELDLKLRYAPKSQSCFSLFPSFRMCWERPSPRLEIDKR